MPRYEYVCDFCGTHFEVNRHFGDPPPETCPQGHAPVHRVFVPPPIIFKGSGFYVTDNGRKSLSGTRGQSKKTVRPETTSEQGD